MSISGVLQSGTGVLLSDIFNNIKKRSFSGVLLSATPFDYARDSAHLFRLTVYIEAVGKSGFARNL